MKPSFFLFGLSLFLVLPGIPALAQPAAPKAVDEKIAIGPNTLVANVITAMGERKYLPALNAIDLFLDRYGDDPRVEEMIERRAICAVKVGRYEEAIPILEDMLKAAEDGSSDQAAIHELLGEAKEGSEDLRFVAADHYRRAGKIFDNLDQIGEINAANAWSKEVDLYGRYFDWRLATDPTPATEEALQEIRLTRITQALDRILNLEINRDLRQSTLQRKAYAIRTESQNAADKADDMLACYEEILKIDDKTTVAGESLFDAASLLVYSKQNYVAAARKYSQLLNFFPDYSREKRVQALLDALVLPNFTLKTTRPFTPEEPIQLDWEGRNVSSVSLSLYPVELISLLRQIGRGKDLAQWETEEKPIQRWSVELPDPGEFRPMVSGIHEVKPISIPITKPGAYVVVGRAGTVVSKRLLIVSRLTAVVKNGSQELLVLVADRESGQPVADAEILLQNRSGVNDLEYQDGKTHENGLFALDLSPSSIQRQRSRTGTAIIRSGDHYAVASHGYFWRPWGYRGMHRIYGFTDRSMYFPGQRVHFKQTVRTTSRDMYGNWPGRDLLVTVIDPAGTVIHEVNLTTNSEGGVSGMFTLPENAVPGLYAITSNIAGNVFGPKESPGNQFRVVTSNKIVTNEEPASEQVVADAPNPMEDLVVKPERGSYVPGETARVHILSNRKSAVVLVTVESDRILFSRLIQLTDGRGDLEIPVGEDFAPNVFVKAAVISHDTMLESKAEIVVPKTREFLSVEVAVNPASPAPGGRAKLHVTTKDAVGQGCPAEVALKMVNAALLDHAPEYRNAIQNHFHGDLRPLMVQTHQQYIYFTGGLLPMAEIDAPQSASHPPLAPDGQDPIEINESLLETALWVPSVMTNADGVAEIEIKWPDRPAKWRLTAIAIDHHGRAGETSTDIAIK